jgi:DNA repair protein RecO
VKEILKNEGVIIHIISYKENASLASILSKEGIKNYIIRGTAKFTSSNAALASLPTKICFAYTSSSLGTITDAKIMNNYTLLKEDITRYNLVLCMFEKINKLTTEDTNYDLLYSFVLTCLSKMEEVVYPSSILTIFEIKMLYILGINPSFKTCGKCSQKIANGNLVIKLGSYVCDDCARNYHADLCGKDAELFKMIYLRKINDVDDYFLKTIAENRNIDDVVDRYYAYHLEFQSKVKKVVKKLL